MKGSNESNASTAASLPRPTPGIMACLELFKFRVCLLVLLTASAGFYFGSGGQLDKLLLFHTLLGTALVAAAGSTFNQIIERRLDAKMERTAGRPLPTGRVLPNEAALIGACLALTGLVYLALAAHPLASLVAGITLFLYSAVYTPLKHRSPLALPVGAIPGALPPMIGWSAARGGLDGPGWAIFGILFAWQIPHFLAIAWLYRDDYAEANFQTLPALDPDGFQTGFLATIWALILIPVSWLPSFWGSFTGGWYLVGATVLGLVYLAGSLALWRSRTDRRARRLFHISLLYLPILVALMMLDAPISPTG